MQHPSEWSSEERRGRNAKRQHSFQQCAQQLTLDRGKVQEMLHVPNHAAAARTMRSARGDWDVQTVAPRNSVVALLLLVP